MSYRCRSLKYVRISDLYSLRSCVGIGMTQSLGRRTHDPEVVGSQQYFRFWPKSGESWSLWVLEGRSGSARDMGL